jgi:zinc transport system permease protein
MEIFEYTFVSNAVILMLLLSVVAGIVGSYIVVRRMVFVSGGVTHASFGGIGMAYYFGVSPLVGALVFAVATALGIELLGQRGKVREDSAIAMLWSLGMSIGVIFMFLTPGYTSNLMGFMFGDVLAVSRDDIYAMLAMALLTIAVAVVFYRPMMYVAFSPSFAKLMNWNVRLISLSMSVMVAVAIVLAIKAVGIILVLSLFTIPQTIANIYVKSFGRMMVISVVIAILANSVGLLTAFVFDLPVGAVVTALLSGVLLVVKIFK